MRYVTIAAVCNGPSAHYKQADGFALSFSSGPVWRELVGMVFHQIE